MGCAGPACSVLRELQLLEFLLQGTPPRRGERGLTFRAGDARLVPRQGFFLRQDRQMAVAARLVSARRQIGIYAQAFIEYKTLPFPEVLSWSHVFQISQNAAVQLIHLAKTLIHDQCCCFFAPDAAGAEHRNRA